MNTPYYTLVVYDIDHNKWYAEFGDYDKSVVQDEMNDLNYGYQSILKKNMKIIKTSVDQSEINKAIDIVNGSKNNV
tara:strand:+ start:605 stop:832 length:228 start_codon:yes stop_codon:yes gene_type:complete